MTRINPEFHDFIQNFLHVEIIDDLYEGFEDGNLLCVLVGYCQPHRYIKTFSTSSENWNNFVWGCEELGIEPLTYQKVYGYTFDMDLLLNTICLYIQAAIIKITGDLAIEPDEEGVVPKISIGSRTHFLKYLRILDQRRIYKTLKKELNKIIRNSKIQQSKLAQNARRPSRSGGQKIVTSEGNLVRSLQALPANGPIKKGSREVSNSGKSRKGLFSSYGKQKPSNGRVLAAVQKQNVDELKKLLSSFSANEADPVTFQTPLHIAASTSLELTIPLLRSDADANAQDQDGCTPLHSVLRSTAINEEKKSQILLQMFQSDLQFDVTRGDLLGLLPIHYAARTVLGKITDYYSILNILIQRSGTNGDIPSSMGETPLHNAIIGDNEEAVQYLLMIGANVNTPTNKGETPLHYAAQYGRLNLAKILIEKGADPWARTPHDENPLEISHRHGHEEFYNYFEALNPEVELEDDAQSGGESNNNDPTTQSESRWRQRSSVVKEIIETERTYTTDLGIIMEVFLTPLRQNPNILAKVETEKIFSNVETILQIHQKLVQELENLVTMCEPTDPNFPICDLYKSYHETLGGPYMVYCCNQDNSLATFGKVKSLPSFAQFLNEAKDNPKCRKLSVDSWVSRPMQRICKYPLLFRELVKYTPTGHPDYDKIEETRALYEGLLSRINKKKNVIVNRFQVKEIHNLLQHETFRILTSGREFIRDETVETSDKVTRRLILFNDILVCAKIKSSTDLRLLFVLYVNYIWIRLGNDDTSFQVFNEDTSELYTIYCSNRQTTLTWIIDILKAGFRRFINSYDQNGVPKKKVAADIDTLNQIKLLNMRKSVRIPGFNLIDSSRKYIKSLNISIVEEGKLQPRTLLVFSDLVVVVQDKENLPLDKTDDLVGEKYIFKGLIPFTCLEMEDAHTQLCNLMFKREDSEYFHIEISFESSKLKSQWVSDFRAIMNSQG